MIRKHFLISVLLFCCGLFAYSQDATLQQLMAARNDTVKVNKLVAYANRTMSADSKQARDLFTLAYQLSTQLNYAAGAGNALLNLGTLNRQAGNYEACNQNLRNAIGFFHKANDTRGVCNSQLGLGSVCELTGKRDSAIYYYMTAINVIEEKQYIPEMAKGYYNIGIIYNNLKDFPKAISYQKKSLNAAKLSKDTSLIASVLGGLSLSYGNAKNYEESYTTAAEAVALAKAKNDKLMICQAYDMYTRACAYIKKFDEAIAAGKDALKYAAELEDMHTFVTASLSLADAYYNKGTYREAIPVLDKALAICKTHENILYGDDIYARLSNIYAKLGNYKKALDAAVELDFYKDSVFNIRKNDIVAEYEVRYRTVQKERAMAAKRLQLAQKDLQLQKSRQYIFYTLSGLLVALLLSGWGYGRYRHKRKEHRRQLHALQQEREIQLLQALMQGEERERSRIAKDLHDGVAGMLAAVKMHFNTLAFHKGHILQSEGYRQGVQLLDEAAVEVRKTSHNLMPEVLLQHGLEEALHRYCRSISNRHTLLVQYDSWGEVGRYLESFELSVYRIVQELLNNIIKHSKATEAVVQLNGQNGVLSIAIEDNGVGYRKGHLQSEGMGLRSLQSRVQALNGKLQVEAQEGTGASAYLEFETIGLEKEKTILA